MQKNVHIYSSSNTISYYIKIRKEKISLFASMQPGSLAVQIPFDKHTRNLYVTHHQLHIIWETAFTVNHVTYFY